MAATAVAEAAGEATLSSEVIVETRNLTKVYRDFWGRQKVQALKALDLEVRRDFWFAGTQRFWQNNHN